MNTHAMTGQVTGQVTHLAFLDRELKESVGKFKL